jgi:large subunit ribosomal protein L10
MSCSLARLMAGLVISERKWLSGGNDLLRSDKERIVAELADQLGAAETLIVADYRGLTNKQLEALRDELLEHGARFRIVKNTLTRQAAERAGAGALLVMLEGPTAIAFIESGGDPAAVAKALATTSRTTNVLTLRGGILEGKTLSGQDIAQLATLPPLDVLRGQLVGAIVAPVTQLLALISAPLQNLHGLIDARIKQLEEQGQVVEPGAPAATDADEATPGESDEATSAVPEAPEAVEADTTADSASAESAAQLDSADSAPEESAAEPAQEVEEEE